LILLIDPTQLKPGEIDYIDRLFQPDVWALLPSEVYSVTTNNITTKVRFTHTLVQYLRKKALDECNLAIIGNRINQGVFGKIYSILGTLSTSPSPSNREHGFFKPKVGDKSRVIKVIAFNGDELEDIITEGILTHGNHALHAKKIVLNSGFAFIIMRKGDVSLADFIESDLARQTERQLVLITRNILLAYLNQALIGNVLHCDIKPANLMLNREDLSILFIDWGFGMKLRQDALFCHLKVQKGTLGYAAPEIYNLGQYSKSSDYFALGMTIAVLWGFKIEQTEQLRWSPTHKPDFNGTVFTSLDYVTTRTREAILGIINAMTVVDVIDRTCSMKQLLDWCDYALDETPLEFVPRPTPAEAPLRKEKKSRCLLM